MFEGWEKRLEETMRARKLSKAALSREAKVGANFVQQLYGEKARSPTLDKLSPVLDALGRADSTYILFNIKITDRELRVLDLLSRAPEAKKMVVETLLEEDPKQAPNSSLLREIEAYIAGLSPEEQTAALQLLARLGDKSNNHGVLDILGT